MKTLLNVFILSILCLFAITACNKEQEIEQENQLIIRGKLTQDSGCKSFKSISINNTESCIEYSFHESINTLFIQHINAGFNCCPDSLYCSVSLNSDTITIEELEKETDCRCNCLYDLEIEIEGVESKEYIIKIIEPYASNEEKLNFEIDLVSDEEGSFCVSRTIYPWVI